jgi:putative hydrolase of the HAD superfamily
MQTEGHTLNRAVLFDLGGTLVDYFSRAEFPGVLEEAITGIRRYLRQRDLLHVSSELLWQRVQAEDHEDPDHRVRPLEARLLRIFQLEGVPHLEDLSEAMGRCFLEPVFARARPYQDAISALEGVRALGFRTAIVSNTPWGSPAPPWREETRRHGLASLVDALVFCRDVGWRKPARQIFEHAAARLQVPARYCLFVGDHREWDVQGSREAGMQALLLDRHARYSGCHTIHSLHDLWSEL